MTLCEQLTFGNKLWLNPYVGSWFLHGRWSVLKILMRGVKFFPAWGHLLNSLFSWWVGSRHSDVPFLKGIVQVSVPLSKFRNCSFFRSFFPGTVTFHVPFPVPFTFTKCEISPAPARPQLYILTVILLYFTAVLNYLILFYYNIT